MVVLELLHLKMKVTASEPCDVIRVNEDDSGIIRDERVNSTRPPLSRSPSHIDMEKESRTRDVYMAGVAVRRSTNAPGPTPPNVFFQFEIIINVLVSTFRFI